MRRLILTTFLFIIAASEARGQNTVDPTFYFGGILDFANAFNKKGAPTFNTFRRGDSPFDNMRATLFGDVAFTPRLTVFNQIILAPASGAAFSSFWRPIIQFVAVQNPQMELFLEAGKLSTTFGSFGPRAYSNQNPLVTAPLMYHYFTSLRAGQLPADNADLLKSRGQGNANVFTGFNGDTATRHGLPIVYDACWDTGMRAFGSLWRLEYSLALTHGTLSDPSNRGGVDSNDGKQIIARVGGVPFTGLFLGASYARGAYLDAAVADTLKAINAVPEDFVQEAFGIDITYEIRHLKLIAEGVWNRWEAPRITDVSGNPTDLSVTSGYIEGRYAFKPGLYGALRVDRMTFGNIDGSAGQAETWDDNLWRLEGGLGYYFWEGVLCKFVVQDIHRVRNPRITFAAVQLSLTF